MISDKQAPEGGGCAVAGDLGPWSTRHTRGLRSQPARLVRTRRPLLLCRQPNRLGHPDVHSLCGPATRLHPFGRRVGSYQLVGRDPSLTWKAARADSRALGLLLTPYSSTTYKYGFSEVAFS